MNTLLYAVSGLLLFMSYAWPLQSRTDVVFRAIFFFVAGLIFLKVRFG